MPSVCCRLWSSLQLECRAVVKSAVRCRLGVRGTFLRGSSLRVCSSDWCDQDVHCKRDEYEEALAIAKKVAQAHENSLGPVSKNGMLASIAYLSGMRRRARRWNGVPGGLEGSRLSCQRRFLMFLEVTLSQQGA